MARTRLLLALAIVASGLATVPPSLASRPECAVADDRLRGSGQVPRTALTRAELESTATATAMVDNAAFGLPADAARSAHDFAGRLSFGGQANGTHYEPMNVTLPHYVMPGVNQLPAVAIDFVQSCSHLIPVARGLQYTSSLAYNIVVSPGRVWHEAADGPWSRAALPFALVERNQNCVHNGVLTFLFDDTHVTPIRYQVSKETCAYFAFDLAGQTNATYAPGPVSNAEGIRSAYGTEVARRVPTQPLSALASDYPKSGIDVATLGNQIPPAGLTTHGVYFRGVNYIGGCATRHGEYPYCEQMLLPSYSDAKSLMPGIGLMRLAQDYGPTVTTTRLADHVPELAVGAGDWTDVTFAHISDMATGNYTTQGDEDGGQMAAFLKSEGYTEKMLAANSWPNQAAPGTRWVYHTSDSFLLTTAESNYLRAQGADYADVWDYLVSTVYEPLHWGPDSLQVLRAGNTPDGAPLGGLGMLLTSDAMVKVARFLNNDGGRIGNRQVLDPGMLQAAMQRDPADRGLMVGNIENERYNTQFWGLRFSIAPRNCSYWVSFTNGYGGIFVVMLPNGATYYYAADNHTGNFVRPVTELDKLAPLC